MTIITKLTAKGFKSFANHTELIFGNNYNMVIGPNGSGKSNIMDALCFVLGKSSAKSMRAEKSANLIYNGGKKNRPAKEAQVSVHFDNSQKEFPVDDKEVRVTRIVRPNGNSIYKLNDQKMTRQQIVDTLSAARIDPDGHNVILQGDIVHFMEMKPEARREVIEEIAGISVYEDKKEKSLKELDKVQERLNSSGIILTERESNLKQLKKERDQAKRYKELQGRLKDNKATLINTEIKQNEERRNKVLSEMSKYDININVVNKRLSEIKNAIQEKRNEITNINIQLEEKGEKEQLILRDEISTLKEDIAKYNARQETVQNEIEKIKTRAIQLKTSLSETNTKISELTKNKKEITNEIEKIHSSENTILKELQIFKKKHKIENIGDFSTKIEEIEQKVDYVSNNIQELQEEKAELVREKDKATYHLDTIKVNLNKIKESKDSSRIEELKTKFENSVKELSKRLTDDSMLATQLHAARSKLVSENQNLAELKAKNLSQQAHLSNNQAIKKIIRDKPKGVYGLVSSLAEVPQEYSLAIEVAAGARANSIVVDNDATAAKLIQMLKQNKLGVVNFLPINKIKARKPQENIKSEGIKGLAHEVIVYDPKFKNIFSYVLGNTVIVDNIETARKIGIGRTRMVTLEGDLMEPSGAMIGGYRKKQGKFSEKEINIKIKELEQETTRLSKIITNLGEKRDQAEETITNLRHEKADYEGSIIKLEKSLGLEIDITQIEEEKIALENQQKEITNDIKDVENKLKTNFNEITQLKKQSSLIRDKLMKDPTITSGLNTLNEKQNKIKETILHKKSEIINIDNQVSMIKTESQRIDQILKSQGKESEDFKNELTNLIQLLIIKNKDLKQRQKKEVDFYGKFKDLATKRNKFSEDIQNKELGIDKENERIRQLELKKNELSIKKATVIAKIDGLNEEFEQFKDGKIRRGINLDQLKTEIKEFETMVLRLGSVNMRALEVYERLETEHKSLVEKQAKLKSEKEDVLSLIAEIDSKKEAVFMKTFRQLKSQFQEIFSLLTKKGEAFLEMENKEEPLQGGVEINVRLHGTHKYLDIRSLSGGEKTLAALAFIFAIQELQPASFYLLDEVDAALDKTNSEKLSQLINQYSSNAQYIVISHNDAIISEAHQIYGVSMQQGVSKVVSLKI